MTPLIKSKKMRILIFVLFCFYLSCFVFSYFDCLLFVSFDEDYSLDPANIL